MKSLICLIVLVLVAACARAAPQNGLVAHYAFTEGSGGVARDSSGCGNDAVNHGATYVKQSNTQALEFDGKGNYLEIPATASLKLDGALTLEAWIKPDSIPIGEPGIVGRGEFFNEFFGLTYFESGGCYFYITTGGNNCTSKVGPGNWHHVAGTFDGRRMQLYVDGRLVASRMSREPQTDTGPNLFIGKNGKDFFKGLISDVRIYSRALSQDEVRADYETGVEDKVQPQNRPPLANPQALNGKGFSVRVGQTGAMEIAAGDSVYLAESYYSYPGSRMGWNSLNNASLSAESAWKPSVTKKNDKQIQVTASGKDYSLQRRITLDGGRIRVEDTLRNTAQTPVGIILRHEVSDHRILREALLGGGESSAVSMIAENPTVFLRQKGSSLGIVAEDNIFRLQFEAASSLEKVEFGAKHFSLTPGKSYTFKWTMYPSATASDYFDFINTVRRDWKANVTVQGPFDWISIPDPNSAFYRIGRAPLDDPAKLKAYLERRKLKIVGFMPYLEYWSGAPLTREELKAKLQRAMKAMRAVDPGIRFIGCTENNIVSYDRAKMPHGKVFDNVCRGKGEYPLELSEEQTRILEKEVPWGDSLVKNKNGRAMIEDCMPTSFIHTMVYSAPGNYHTRHLLDMAKFLMEDVGMDGVYMDHFNMAFENTQRYHYAKWDGVTVDIDRDTGEITRRYTDAAIVGIKPKQELCDYIFSRGGVFVVNNHNVANETQSMPIMHFEEVGSNADPNSLQPGEEPALNAYIARLQLDSPIGLGIPSSNKERPDLQNAEEVYKNILVYLRHGLLYYHNQTAIPETGPGSGEYGPINHMFPLTPLELHKGWLKGKERIVTAVSLDTLWSKRGAPIVHVFDLTGREVDSAGRLSASKEAGKWRVNLKLKDWQEIAVVE